MPVFVNTFFDERVKQLFDLADLVEKIFFSAGLDYRLVGGLAAYLYIEERVPDAGRLPKDIDIAVRRQDLEKIAVAAEPFGLQLRHVAGADMLLQAGQPSARRAVHLVAAGEKVRPEYLEPTPDLGPYRRIKELQLLPLGDLVRMKLTSFRAHDEAHLKDLDDAGLIAPESKPVCRRSRRPAGPLRAREQTRNRLPVKSHSQQSATFLRRVFNHLRISAPGNNRLTPYTESRTG